MKTVADAVEILRSSERFRQWRPPSRPIDLRLLCDIGTERHYTPTEVAKQWGVSVQTVRSIFDSEPGVLKIGSNGTRNRRRYKTLRIPESVVVRVHTRLSA
jgi:hypothetical protein